MSYSYPKILKVLLFYLIVALIVVYSGPLGRFGGYVLIAAVSLLFILTSGIKLRPGNPLPGSITGTLAISGTFLVMLAIGGIAIAGVSIDAVDVLAYGILLQAFVAIGEEVSFRQYIFEDLDQATGRTAAVLLSSVGFALMHLHAMTSFGVDIVTAAIGLITISLAGVLLAVLYIYGGLLSAIGFHFFWNFLQYHILGLGLRSEVPSVVHVTQTGSILTTGGAYGPEASLPGLVVVLITLCAVWYWYIIRQRQACERRQGGQDAR